MAKTEASNQKPEIAEPIDVSDRADTIIAEAANIVATNYLSKERNTAYG